MQTSKVFKNNYFGFPAEENCLQRICNVRIFKSLGELNLA